MTDDAHPWDDAPEDHPPAYFLPLEPTSHAGKRIAAGKGKKKKPKKEKPPAVPRLPTKEIALTGDEVKRGVSERSRSAANLKIEGYTYAEIADLLEFESPADARRAVESVLAAIHGPGELETVRLVVTGRAEAQFKRSFAMAGASFLVLADGTEVPNTDQARWHQQASVDLMNLATITGAKAPSRIEFTPGEERLEAIAAELARRAGHQEILEAEVIDLDVVPDEPDLEDLE